MKRGRVLVTGAAGFIGYHLAGWLLRAGWRVVGLDSVDSYYDVNLKHGRLGELGIPTSSLRDRELVASSKSSELSFVRADVCDGEYLQNLLSTQGITHVCHLAAQAGVRYSLENPHRYVESNVIGFLNVLEACRHHSVEHLLYASSSSVYGLNRKVPFAATDNVDHPISVYAATKKSDELLAHCYSHLYGVPTTGLRFFTVYGPWGRPDMALFKFTAAILKGEAIEVYNEGRMVRDFTYVDDVVEATGRMLSRVPCGDEGWNASEPRPDSSSAPYRVFNVGNSSPVPLMEFVAALEKELARKAEIRYLPMQPGDVPKTVADTRELEAEIGFRPRTTVSEGIREFVHWYRRFYGL